MKDLLHMLTTTYSNELNDTQKRILELMDQQSNEDALAHMKYVAAKSGHMLRPLVAFITFGAITGKPYATMTAKDKRAITNIAAALELLHTASLVHDDVIDLTTVRRGQPTVNAKHGNTEAVLVGNLFYLNAFKLMLELNDPWYLDVLIKTAEAMCVGEIIQAETHQESINQDVYIDIIAKKTGALISAAAKLSAYLAGADQLANDFYSELALNLGIMYQMRDDLQDHDLENFDSKALASLMQTYSSKLSDNLEHLDTTQPHQEALIQFIHYFKGSVI